MIQVKNNTIIKTSLPASGRLKNGRLISNYHLLDTNTLLQEGWLPLDKHLIDFDEEAQELVHESYEILSDKVIERFKVVSKAATNEFNPSLEERIIALEGMELERIMEGLE